MDENVIFYDLKCPECGREFRGYAPVESSSRSGEVYKIYSPKNDEKSFSRIKNGLVEFECYVPGLRHFFWVPEKTKI